MDLFKTETNYHKANAQRNLYGRTHYVDDDTLRFHKSRIMTSHTVDGGLLFAIVTSDALNYENTKRGFRFVIFDLFGTVIARTEIEAAFRTRAQATKAMWAALTEIDAPAVTLAGLAKHEANQARDNAELRATVAKIAEAAK